MQSQQIINSSRRPAPHVKRVRFAAIGLAVAGLSFVARPAHADSITLTDLGVSATIDYGTPTGASPSAAPFGVTDLVLQDGTDQFGNGASQDFYYSESGGAGAPIETLPNTAETPTGSNEVDVAYAPAGGGFTINVIYTLTGGSTPSLNENISVQDGTDPTMDTFDVFQLSNWHVGGTAYNGVNITGTPPGSNNTATQYSNSVDMSETVETPPPNEYAADYASTLKTEIESPNPLLAGPSSTGGIEDNVGSAFQVNGTLLDGLTIDTTDNVVPEPASVSLLAAGAAGLLARRRRNRNGVFGNI